MQERKNCKRMHNQIFLLSFPPVSEKAAKPKKEREKNLFFCYKREKRREPWPKIFPSATYETVLTVAHSKHNKHKPPDRSPDNKRRKEKEKKYATFFTRSLLTCVRLARPRRAKGKKKHLAIAILLSQSPPLSPTSPSLPAASSGRGTKVLLFWLRDIPPTHALPSSFCPFSFHPFSFVKVHLSRNERRRTNERGMGSTKQIGLKKWGPLPKRGKERGERRE